MFSSPDKKLPFVAIGNDELARAEPLGPTVACWVCEGTHEVQYGEKVLPDGSRVPSKLLAFFKCGDATYLCGMDGKAWRPASSPKRD